MLNINKKLIEAITAIVTVYGPLDFKQIEDYLKKYYPDLLKGNYKEEIDVYLDSLVYANRLYKKGKKYSAIDFNILKEVSKQTKELSKVVEGKEKVFDRDTLLKYADFNKLDGIKEYDELKKYIYSLDFKDPKVKDEILFALCLGDYFCYDAFSLFDVLKRETKNVKLDDFTEYVGNFSGSLPRPFLHGYSYKEIDDISETIYKTGSQQFDDFFSPKNKIKGPFLKSKYNDFSYQDCIELGKKVDKCEIFKLVDSDRILEFFINEEVVYVQILGFYNRDNAIIIYRNRNEMLNAQTILQSDDVNAYPDMAYHMSCIEVTLRDSTNFLTLDMEQKLKNDNLPLLPNFVTLEAAKERRFPNQRELNLIGGVLTDILRLVKISNLSEIALHLGDKDESVKPYDISQVYVLDNEVLYGEYNEIELGDYILPYKLNKVDKKLIKAVKKCPKHEISLGTYITGFSIEDEEEFPHITIIYDNTTGLIVGSHLYSSKNIKDVKNEILKKLIDANICPKVIACNNEYCFELFDEYLEFFDLYIGDNENLNEIYEELTKASSLNNMPNNKNYS